MHYKYNNNTNANANANNNYNNYTSNVTWVQGTQNFWVNGGVLHCYQILLFVKESEIILIPFQSCSKFPDACQHTN